MTNDFKVKIDKRIIFLVNYKVKFSYEIPENFPESLLNKKNEAISLTKTHYNKKYARAVETPRPGWGPKHFEQDNFEQYQINILRGELESDVKFNLQKIVEDHMIENFNLSLREKHNLHEDYDFRVHIDYIYDKTNDKLLYDRKQTDEVIDGVHTRSITIKHHNDGLLKFN